MLPRTVCMVRTARRAEMPVSETATAGEIVRPGVSNWVSRNGAPIAVPRSGSNRTAQRLKNGEPWFEMNRLEVKSRAACIPLKPLRRLGELGELAIFPQLPARHLGTVARRGVEPLTGFQVQTDRGHPAVGMRRKPRPLAAARKRLRDFAGWVAPIGGHGM